MYVTSTVLLPTFRSALYRIASLVLRRPISKRAITDLLDTDFVAPLRDLTYDFSAMGKLNALGPTIVFAGPQSREYPKDVSCRLSAVRTAALVRPGLVTTSRCAIANPSLRRPPIVERSNPWARTSSSAVTPCGKLASSASAWRCSLLRLGSPGDAVIRTAVSESLGGDGRVADTGLKNRRKCAILCRARRRPDRQLKLTMLATGTDAPPRSDRRWRSVARARRARSPVPALGQRLPGRPDLRRVRDP
jgi:hypothetical protein